MKNQTSYDKNEKRFNFIDLLIILTVLLIAAAVIFRAQIITFFNDGERRSESVITFKADSVPMSTVEHVKTGTNVRWLERGLELGKLETFTASPAILYVPGLGGTVTTVGDANNCAVVGTIKADIFYDEGCYIEGNAFLAPGMTITLYSDSAQLTVTVVDIAY